MLANEKLYEMKVPNNIVLNPKDGVIYYKGTSEQYKKLEKI